LTKLLNELPDQLGQNFKLFLEYKKNIKLEFNANDQNALEEFLEKDIKDYLKLGISEESN
jgi:predicted solute-binding protein